MNVHEKNYHNLDLELVAVVSASKIWRHYIYGVHVDVFFGHKSLQYVFKLKIYIVSKEGDLSCLKIMI